MTDVWGLDVRWARERGMLTFTDPFTGERVEVAADGLKHDNPRLDLRWMVRRAMDNRPPKKGPTPLDIEEARRLIRGVVPKRGLSR